MSNVLMSFLPGVSMIKLSSGSGGRLAEIVDRTLQARNTLLLL